MQIKNKTMRLGAWLASLFLILACIDFGTPAVTEPAWSPSQTPILIPVESPPVSTLGPTPKIRPADTLVPAIIPSPTNTDLPPLPDFDQVLSFGTGGAEDGFCRDWGDATDCYFYDTPQYDPTSALSQVEGNWNAASQEPHLEVSGRNFPPNLPVFILLYVDVQDASAPPPDPNRPHGKYQLVDERVGVADSGGLVSLTITSPWEGEKKYLLVASTDPNGNIQLRYGQADESRQNRAAPWFVFTVPGNTSSCSGAPPQRMIVNLRGYVCTRSDPVRLRAAPARLAITLIQLSTGTQFTVIGGPFCSDEWSWWNVRLEDGTTGWLSEGGDAVDPYFICPLP